MNPSYFEWSQSFKKSLREGTQRIPDSLLPHARCYLSDRESLPKESDGRAFEALRRQLEQTKEVLEDCLADRNALEKQLRKKREGPEESEPIPTHFQAVILDSIGESVIVTDMQGQILYWNKAAEKLYGWQKHEVLGKNIINITTVEENLEQGQEIMKALQSGLSWSGEFIVQHKDGHRFVAWVTDYALRDEHDQLSAIIGVSSDLSERKQIEEQKNILEERLYQQLAQSADAERILAERANRFKSEFIAHMSHEIRTPLSVIKGYADLLTLDENQQLRPQWVEAISHASEQLELLVSDILDISKIEAGKIQVERVEVELMPLLIDLKGMLSLKAREKNIELQFEVQGRVPVFVHSDPLRLNQILINVVGNAIKFTEKGFVRVSVGLQASTEPTRAPLLAFTVSDSGIGMSEEQKQRVFEPFFQADQSISRRFGGTGLGLTLSLQLARLLGGDLSIVASEPQQGSVFQLTIDPGIDANSQLIDAFPLRSTSTHPRELDRALLEDLKDLRILIVDDADDIRALLTFILSSQGAQIVEAVQGADALRLYQENPEAFDVILMDIQMPVLDGYETVRRLREEGCRLPIFALTAHALAGERERCRAAGFSNYLSKPFHISDMLHMLHEAQKTEP